jgi:hypothetical protein
MSRFVGISGDIAHCTHHFLCASLDSYALINWRVDVWVGGVRVPAMGLEEMLGDRFEIEQQIASGSQKDAW